MPCIWSTMVRTCLPFVLIHHHSELHPTPESIPTRSTSLALHSSLRTESLPLKHPFSRLSTTGTTCSFRAERSFFPNLDDGRNCEALEQYMHMVRGTLKAIYLTCNNAYLACKVGVDTRGQRRGSAEVDYHCYRTRYRAYSSW